MILRRLNAAADLDAGGASRRFAPSCILSVKNPPAARRAVAAIREGVKLLSDHPGVGRPVEEMSPEFREWPIGFGSRGYVALYRIDGQTVVILAVRHGREAGY